MRLLLIFALFFASVTFGPAAGAQAHQEDAEHHAHAAQGHQDHGREGNPDKDKTHAVTHVCPGCALIGQPTVADAETDQASLPRIPANPPSMRSFQANPIPPPPRLS